MLLISASFASCLKHAVAGPVDEPKAIQVITEPKICDEMERKYNNDGVQARENCEMDRTKECLKYLAECHDLHLENGDWI